jgi:hypothetical protein
MFRNAALVYSEITYQNSAFLAINPLAYISTTFLYRVKIKSFVVLVRGPCCVLCSFRRFGGKCNFGIDGKSQSSVDKNVSYGKGGQQKRRERQATTQGWSTRKA